MATNIMSPLSSTLSLLLALLTLTALPSAAQLMKPDPTFDCTNPNFRVIYTACSAGEYGRCCAVGTSCCAGGCCDLTSNCLNVGTADEVCCSALDANFCGYYNASSTTPPFAVQSVACTGADGLSSYYCPPGATCNSAVNGCIGGSSTGSGTGSGSNGGSGSSVVSAVRSSTLGSAAGPSSVSDDEPEATEFTIVDATSTPVSGRTTTVNAPLVSTVVVGGAGAGAGASGSTGTTGSQVQAVVTVTATPTQKNSATRDFGLVGYVCTFMSFAMTGLMMLL